VIDRDEQELFERSLRAAIERSTGPALDEELVRLGWYEALRSEPRMAVAALFGLQGLLNATSPLDPVVASALCPEDPMAAIVLPAFGSSDPPGETRRSAVVVHGLGSRRTAVATQALVAVGSEAGAWLLAIPLFALELRPVRGLDPALGVVEVNGTVEKPTADDSAPSDAWPKALSLARLALAHELIGASRSMLGLARDHAVERVQFGRPISSFQAVRHRLADSLVAVAAAEASADAAWDEQSAFSAAVAKAVAGRSALVVARHAQQVLAGMGFTAEHPLHRFVKRTLALDQLLGSSASLTRSVGGELLGARTLPSAVRL
jgi:Acyl-CoA dehydrogenase, C-terminal domain